MGPGSAHSPLVEQGYPGLCASLQLFSRSIKVSSSIQRADFKAMSQSNRSF